MRKTNEEWDEKTQEEGKEETKEKGEKKQFNQSWNIQKGEK